MQGRSAPRLFFDLLRHIPYATTLDAVEGWIRMANNAAAPERLTERQLKRLWAEAYRAAVLLPH